MKLFVVIALFATLTQVILGSECKHSEICGSFPSFCKKSRYRSYDGSCNNLQYPQWGTAYSAYARLVNSSYSDGIHGLPLSCRNEPLMNPRSISLMVFPDVISEDKFRNVIALQWGQIVAHDMSFTLGVPQTGVDDIACCTNGEPVCPTKAGLNPRCAAIPIPHNDPFNTPEGNTCINFVRTISNKDKKCSVPGKTEEPLSAVTSFHDLSIMYGNSELQARKVRAFKKGKLAFVIRKGEQWLPQDSNVTFACNNVRNAQEPCYFTGDIRVNQNPQLALMQNVLMREHNRIAAQLCEVINPHWDDERCFQESRRILIAESQHITYKWFLPLYLGEKNVIKKRISYPNAVGYVNDYNPNINPQTLNEHSTAAYRGFHTQIVGQLKMYSQSRRFIGELRLSDWFNRPSIIEETTPGLASGLTTQIQEDVDRFFNSEVSEYFFRNPGDLLGTDLRAIDIQRSRDHGIGTYPDLLEACGLGRPKCFRDLTKYIKKEYVKLLMKVYKDVDDVELAVAGLLETKVNDTLAGPAFLCILNEQFYRTRVGDRYFYENGFADIAFTPRQLDTIRKVTMSRIFCDNVKGIHLMQPNAFVKISDKNPLVNCNTLPRVDLWLWKE